MAVIQNENTVQLPFAALAAVQTSESRAYAQHPKKGSQNEPKTPPPPPKKKKRITKCQATTVKMEAQESSRSLTLRFFLLLLGGLRGPLFGVWV